MENEGGHSLSPQQSLLHVLGVTALAAIIWLGAQGCVSRDTITITSITRVDSRVADRAHSDLQRSRCFWLGAGEAETVAWEAAVTAIQQGRPVSFTYEQPPPPRTSNQLNACYEGPLLADPPGGHAAIPAWSGLVPASIVQCEGDPPDSLGTCVSHGEGGCRVLANQGCAGGSPPYNYPYCSSGCDFSFSGHDATLELKTTGYPPIVLPPTFYPVISDRILARQTQPCTTSDPNAGILDCPWQETAGSDGLWSENFSADLFVSRVRAFVVPPGANPSDSRIRRYLKLDRVVLGAPPVNFRCHPNAIDPTQVDDDSCSDLMQATPAYLKSSFGQSVPWVVQTLDAAHGGDPGLAAGAQALVEFTVDSTIGNSLTPYLDTGWYPFGVVTPGQTVTRPAAIRLHLDGVATSWTMQSIVASGSTPSDFSLRLEGPMTIAPGGLRGLDATFQPMATGVRSATMTVNLSDPQGRTIALPVDFIGWSGAQSLTLIPNSITFRDERDHSVPPPFPQLPLPWRKKFLLENTLYYPLERRDVSISAPGSPFQTAAFRVLNGAGTAPPPATNITPTGGTELFTVEFCPHQR